VLQELWCGILRPTLRYSGDALESLAASGYCGLLEK